MATIYTIEGNTNAGNTLIANGGGVNTKSYSSSYTHIASIWRPKYRDGEATKVICEALKWKGYLEKKSNASLDSFTANAGSNNYNCFAPHAKSTTGASCFVNGQPWCAMFVEDVMIRALGASRAKELLYDWSAYTPTVNNYLGKVAVKVSPFSMAQYGDIILFKNSTRICHVGLVTNGYSATKNSTTATGNKASYTKTQFIKDVQSALGVEVDGIAGKQTLNATVTVSVKTNKRHAVVKPIQKYLNSLGYDCGEADGVAGSKFDEALKNYQSQWMSNPDGIISKGGKTWKKLLGLA